MKIGVISLKLKRNMDNSELIIEEVKKNECLYNLASKEYKNVQKKSEIWQEIGSSLNLSGDSCKKRWRGLRDTYKRHKRAAQLTSGSGAPTPTKKWKYMDSLRFLDDYKDSRPTIGSVLEEEIDLHYLFDCSSSTVLTDNSITQHTDDSNDANEARQKKHSKKQSDMDVTSVFKGAMEECVNTVKELASKTNSTERDRDATSMLFESLALKISEANLPQVTVRRIESKVITLVYEELTQSCITREKEN